MFKNLGVQLYTIRDYLKDPEIADVAFAKLARLGYTEMHTAESYDFDRKLLCELLTKHGIRIIGSHYSLDEILNNPEKTMEIHRMWGTTNVGIGGAAKTKIEDLNAFIKDFNRAAEIYGKEGFRLTYHHHHYEFARIDGLRNSMEILFDELDPVNTSFVADTCWLAAGGADVCSWLYRLKGRIDILHLKDLTLKRNEAGYLLPYITEVGNGNLTFDPIMKVAEEIGVKHYVVEQDGNFTKTPFESLRMSAEFLAKYMA